jgi:uncharacterized membrane protein (UPF0127 family)
MLSNVFVADTFLKRLIGYMFRKEPHHEALMIKPCNSIHTFFMKFNIDVIFVDKDMKVLKKVENLKPGKVIMPVKDAWAVIEGKAGKFKNINIEDKIDI